MAKTEKKYSLQDVKIGIPHRFMENFETSKEYRLLLIEKELPKEIFGLKKFLHNEKLKEGDIELICSQAKKLLEIDEFDRTVILFGFMSRNEEELTENQKELIQIDGPFSGGVFDREVFKPRFKQKKLEEGVETRDFFEYQYQVMMFNWRARLGYTEIILAKLNTENKLNEYGSELILGLLKWTTAYFGCEVIRKWYYNEKSFRSSNDNSLASIIKNRSFFDSSNSNNKYDNLEIQGLVFELKRHIMELREERNNQKCDEFIGRLCLKNCENKTLVQDIIKKLVNSTSNISESKIFEVLTLTGVKSDLKSYSRFKTIRKRNEEEYVLKNHVFYRDGQPNLHRYQTLLSLSKFRNSKILQTIDIIPDMELICSQEL